MDIDASVIDQVGDATYARWKDAALADLANILCQKALFQLTDDCVGIVVGDGRHVALLAWYSDVTNVQNAYQMIIRIAVRTPLMMIFSLIMAFSINAKVS